MGVLNVHLPPKATLTETGKQLDTWGNMRIVKEQALVVMGDFNETLTRNRETDELTHRTARGALSTQWYHDHDLSAPPQQSTDPHRPRKIVSSPCPQTGGLERS